MRIKQIIVGLAIMSCLFTGCGKEVVSGGNEMNTNKAMDDYQYMIEVWGFTEEELEGLDIIDIVESTRIRKDNVSSEDAHEVVALLRDSCKDKNGKNEKFLIMTADGGPGISSDIEVAKICFRATMGNESYLEVYDISNKVCYLTGGNVAEMTDEQAESLKTIANRYNVKDWAQYTEGGKQTTGGCTWKLVFQDKNGSYYVYEGNTPDFSTFPPTYNELRNELIAVTEKP